MKYKIPDILALGFICQFFFIAFGGVVGFFANWILFIGMALCEYNNYLNSTPGIKRSLMNKTYSGTLFSTGENTTPTYNGEPFEHEDDIQAYAAAKNILYQQHVKEGETVGTACAVMEKAIINYDFKFKDNHITMRRKYWEQRSDGLYVKKYGKEYKIC